MIAKWTERSGRKRMSAENLTGFLNESELLSEDSAALHSFILRIFSELLCAPAGEVFLFHHRRRNGKRWTLHPQEEEHELAVNAQLEFMLNDKALDYLKPGNPLLGKITPLLSPNGKVNEGVLFRMTDELDYLLLMNSEIQETSRLDLFLSLVRITQGKVHTRAENKRLKKKNELLEKSLAISERKLRETEKSLRKRIYEINNLLEISNELYSILDLEQMINAALLIIIGQIGSEKAFVLLHEPMQAGFYKQFSKGFGSETTHITVDLDDPIVNYMLKTRQPLLIRELEEERELQPFIASLKQDNIRLVAPLIYSERLEGIVGCGEKLFGEEWGHSDMQMFSILVNIISVSLGNASMYENVKKMSFTDGMTNLNNYRYFENRLREEIKRARRQNSRVSMIMLDIDHFKNYNDTLGHQAGDEALRQLGALLKSTAREDDIVNRYGGEEFSIILPGIEKESITILAERLRKTIEQAEFYKQEIQPKGRLTISLGGATFPDDADSFEQLIKKADKALYKSKECGRNRFTIYDKSLE